MQNYLQNKKKELQNLKQELQNISQKLYNLEHNDDVHQYLKLSEQEQTMVQKIDQLEENIIELEMISCNHLFVRTSLNQVFDYEMRPSEPIIKCLKCGLTNKFLEADVSPYELPPLCKKQNDIFIKTYSNGIVLKTGVVHNFNNTKEMLSNMMMEHPEYNNNQLAEKLESKLNQNKVKEKVIITK